VVNSWIFFEFNCRERKPGVLNKRCTRCTREYFRNYYARHRDVYALHTRQKNAEGRMCNRERLLGYLRLHPVRRPRRNRSAALQFNREDRTSKASNVGDLLGNGGFVDTGTRRDRETLSPLR